MLFLFYSVLKIYLLIFFLFSEENLAAIVQWPPGFLRKTEKILKGKFLKPNKIKKA